VFFNTSGILKLQFTGVEFIKAGLIGLISVKAESILCRIGVIFFECFDISFFKINSPFLLIKTCNQRVSNFESECSIS